MNRITVFTIIHFFLILSSCTTTSENIVIKPEIEVDTEIEPVTLTEHKESLFSDIELIISNTYPSDNSFRIAALSPRFQNHDDEIQFALKNAAKQIACFYGSFVSYQKLMDENIIGTLHFQQINVIYDQVLASSIVDKLEIINESSDHDYYIAIISMKADKLPTILPTMESIDNSRPSWVNNPPEFDGFITGVGFSGRRKSVYHSWEQADKQSIAEIVNIISTNVLSGSGTIERGSTSSGASTSVIKTYSTSDVHIKGFYILSRWREPDGSNYYTLAIADKP